MAKWEKMAKTYESREAANASAKRKLATQGISEVQVRKRKDGWIVKFQLVANST